MKLLRPIHFHFCSFFFLAVLPLFTFAQNSQKIVNHSFAISFAKAADQKPITGRVFLMISKDKSPEPRFEAGSYMRSIPFWGKDVDQLELDAQVVIDTSTLGYPLDNIRDLPEGDYYVQGVMNVYTQFHRADGHTIWAHQDQWEGQRFNVSPGNLISSVQKIHYDPSVEQSFSIKLDSMLPAIHLPADTKQVKHIKIKSSILSAFWGHDMYLGATILLPDGYDTHTSVHYPVVYEQGHFSLGAPEGFTTEKREIPPAFKAIMESYNLEGGYEFQKEYNSDHFPRMIIVTFQHPTPFYDDSYAVNSANVGPYGDAIMKELIPYIENKYRIIQKPYARVLTGGSTGGWESMALQIYHPDFFGGTWSLYPDPLDFRHFQLVDLTKDTNAFYTNAFTMPFNANSIWQSSLRYSMCDNEGQPVRTEKDMSQLEAVLGSLGRSGEQLNVFDAVFGPIGNDGYPEQFWDKLTGKIDSNAVNYARDHGYDLRYYLANHWSELGPKLIDKLHVYVGDADNFYLNLAVYQFQDFLKHTTDPHYEGTFEYGRPMKGHGWQPVKTSELLRMMAKHITEHAPKGTDNNMWKY
ncbi:MAG TPA: alpha/beta hydrolase-fold protein [Hanamia sp.]